MTLIESKVGGVTSGLQVPVRVHPTRGPESPQREQAR
jgi:hypothetical protein